MVHFGAEHPTSNTRHFIVCRYFFILLKRMRHTLNYRSYELNLFILLQTPPTALSVV